MKFPTYKELGEIAAKEALDTFEYNGKTLREWIEIISAAELGTNLAEVGADLISRQAAIEDVRTWVAIDGREEHLKTDVIEWLKEFPSAQPEIIYCKDCVKHNKGHGYYYDGTVIGIKDCCPLVEIRGRAQGHEFDYQFCAYAERRQDV